MKILITGGHITPALAVIEELEKKKNVKVVVVGRKYAFDREKVFSFEYLILKKKKIRFLELKTGRFTRIFSLKSFLSVFKFPVGVYQAFKILLQEKPDIVLSFGGYLALPIGLCAFFLKIPLFTHEQTLVAGFTNRLISVFSKKVFISFPQTKKFFPPKKTIYTGNPIRSVVFRKIKKPFKIKKNRPIIYITGGSLGSHSINLLVETILKKLLEEFIVIHQIGDTLTYQDFERLSLIKNKYYFPRKHFLDEEIGWVYSLADLVIGRAGANTVFELIALKKPAILIPLPWSAGKEQIVHAQFLKKFQVAEVLYQTDNIQKDSQRLYSLIKKMIKNISFYKKNYKVLAKYHKPNASSKIISKILEDF